MHILTTILQPLYALGYHLAWWIDNQVIGSFALGTTAKEIAEQEVGALGVGAYIVYKLGRLSLDLWATFRPDWTPARAAHAALAFASSIAGTVVIVLLYLGALGELLQAQVTVGAALVSVVVGWIAVGYRRLADLAQSRIEAQTERED